MDFKEIWVRIYNAPMAMHLDTTITKEEAAQAGECFYEGCLRSMLEPTHNGKLVAIHIPSKEYFLGESLLEASDRLRERQPRAGLGEIYARGVGNRAVIRAHTPRVTRT